jgi:putative nucleotidyltransferase with HDIG domain
MNRSEAIELLKKYVKNEKMLYHSYASEIILRALTKKLGENEEKWALAGLLHDIDVEITNADPKTHCLEAEKILKELNIDPEIIDAVKMHNEEATGIPRTSKFQHALAAGETISGLIYATALVYPDKKITSVKPKSVVKRMKEKAFAAAVSRDTILECEKIGLTIEEFAEIAVNAMKEIGPEIGL